MKIYTQQIYRHKDTPGFHAIDVTVKSGERAFAPSWGMVNGIKNGTISWELYQDMYKLMMQLTQENYPHQWDALLQHENVVLMCYCYKPDQCHRLLLANMVVEYARSKGIEAEYAGELQ